MRNAVVLALLATSTPTLAADWATPSVHIAGTYSDLAYDGGSGDLLGTEIRIVYSLKGHYAVIQCSAGVPAVTPLKVHGDRIEFALTEAHEDSLCGSGTRTGIVSADALELWESSRPESKLRLKRQPSYWDRRDGAM